MKYVLDVALVAGLLWMGWLWQGERQAGLGKDDQLALRDAKVVRLEQEVAAAGESVARAQADVAAVREELAQANGGLQAAVASLAAKSAEADALKEAGLRLKARVEELEGYKARASMAQMPGVAAPEGGQP